MKRLGFRKRTLRSVKAALRAHHLDDSVTILLHSLVEFVAEVEGVAACLPLSPEREEEEEKSQLPVPAEN